MAGAAANSPLCLATVRLTALVDRLADRGIRNHETTFSLLGGPENGSAMIIGPLTPLLLAARRAALPSPQCELTENILALSFNVPRGEGPTEWTLAMVQCWLRAAESGENAGELRDLDIARVRVAARMLGGSSNLHEQGAARALLTLRFARSSSWADSKRG